ncbi:MAG: hypothetical protein R6X16_05015 [Anaerolineae bacterium]
MKRNRFSPLMAAGAVALALSLAACRPVGVPLAPSDPTAPAPFVEPTLAVPALPARAGVAPDRVAHAFYIWYVAATEASFGSGVSVYDDASLEEGYLAPALLQDIRARREAMSAAPGGADMLLCAQDVPQTVEALLESVDGDAAVVLMTSDLIGHRWRLEMERYAGEWRIAAIDCRPEERVAVATPTPLVPLGGKPFPTGESPAPTLEVDSDGWLVYDSAAYGFRFSYPADWTHQEHVSEPDQLPIGPEELELLVMIMPQAWADAMAARSGPPDPEAPAIAPFTLEVFRGDEETLRLNYPQPEQAAAIGLGGGPATREVEVFGEGLSLVRYVVQHPSDPELWLVITDSITGFSDRVADNEGTLATFAEILETLQLY